MDTALRLQLLRASARDRIFLDKCWRDISAEDFSDREEAVVVEAALSYWDRYKEPVGPMLEAEAGDLAAARKFGAESRKKLKSLIAGVQTGQTENVSVQALVDRVRALKVARFNEQAIEELIAQHERNELTPESFGTLVQQAVRELSGSDLAVSDVFSPAALKKRIVRRSTTQQIKYPLLMIEPLDEKIKAIGRGQLALFLAPYKGGKGLALVWIAVAYAMQGLKVMFLTLEDPVEVVEDRFDAAVSGIPVPRLHALPRRLRKRFRKMRRVIRGRIKVIDATQGGWTVPRVEKAWESLRGQGFTADAVVVDYDDEIEATKKFKGDDARRFEFADIYRQMRQAAARLKVIWWTAAQATRKAETKTVITGQDTAEDISKIRKVNLAIGIGRHEKEADVKFLYVIAHKTDRMRFGVEIVGDYDGAIFYDREKTLARRKRPK